MKICNILYMTLFGVSVLSPLFGMTLRVQAEPRPRSNEADSSKQRSVGKLDVDDFCAKSTNKPKPGFQFDGKRAATAIMQLAPGKYEYPNAGALLLFSSKHYLIKLPTDSKGIYGTDGDDILFGGGIVGGCSSEQLSEAISNNKMSVNDLKLVNPYN
ncbi:hypothetical protein C1752_01531 [Acaryochloris thomasi RCC1774]|uniref:Uncharacterized protein n=1 Tax=Acaryochloris thomasi RCC1774 TaxID=1764569 RepID=A0A2W1K1B4_9CYAN|nr:hypothetical protein [Acaryochloris thomasi]PZD73967.1 hypothetical protein C1752_01531 [Acaryochloris thomasi RCC1774]